LLVPHISKSPDPSLDAQPPSTLPCLVLISDGELGQQGQLCIHVRRGTLAPASSILRALSTGGIVINAQSIHERELDHWGCGPSYGCGLLPSIGRSDVTSLTTTILKSLEDFGEQFLELFSFSTSPAPHRVGGKSAYLTYLIKSYGPPCGFLKNVSGDQALFYWQGVRRLSGPPCRPPSQSNSDYGLLPLLVLQRFMPRNRKSKVSIA